MLRDGSKCFESEAPDQTVRPATRQTRKDALGGRRGARRSDPEDPIVAASLVSRPLPGTDDRDTLARRQIDLMKPSPVSTGVWDRNHVSGSP